MKKVTNDFKSTLISDARVFDKQLTQNGERIELNNIVYRSEASLLKSLMKELEVDSLTPLEKDSIVNYKIGLKVNAEFEYINYGNFVVYSVEKQEDTQSYKVICYDKMLYSMKKNENLGITYPITISGYIKAICNKIGLIFANENDTFKNYDKVITQELYFGQDYTYRDILDELAQATGSIILINENDELELKYVEETKETFNEDYLKNYDINFGEKYGPINSVVLCRSAESDNIYLRDEESITTNGLCEIKIINNQIMNFNDRSDYLQGIFDSLNGVEFYTNNFQSYGFLFLEANDKYNVKVGDVTYPCLMLENEIRTIDGVEEYVNTIKPEQTQTDYTKADKTDRRINQAYLLVDKQNKKINAVVETTETIQKEIVTNGGASGSIIKIEDGANEPLISFEIDGKSVQDTRSGKNKLSYDYHDGISKTVNGITFTVNLDGSVMANGTATANARFDLTSNTFDLPAGTYKLVGENEIYANVAIRGSYRDSGGTIKYLGSNSGNFVIDEACNSFNFYIVILSGQTVNNIIFYPMLLLANETDLTFERGGISPSPDYPSQIESVGYENILNVPINFDVTLNKTLVDIFIPTGSYVLKASSITSNASTFTSLILFYNNDTLVTQTYIGGTQSLKKNIALSNDVNKILIYSGSSYNDSVGNTTTFEELMITKGTEIHSYIHYGKYGVEVKTTGKNKLRGLSVPTDDTEYWIAITPPYFTSLEDGWGRFEYDNTNGTSTVFINAKVKLKAVDLKPNKEYTIVTELRNSSISENSGAFFQILTANPTVAWQTARSLGYANINKGGVFKTTSKTKENFDGIECSIDTYLRLSAGTKGKVEARISIFEEDVDITNFEYDEYKSNTLLLELNEPLRSLPSGVKDVAYIKNNVLYVDRKIKSVIFDGSETNWSLELINNTIPRYYMWLGDGLPLTSRNEIMSNRFLRSSEFNDYHVVGMAFEYGGTIYLYPNTNLLTIDAFKSWLSTNNTEVIYELAEPYTENLGEIEMPSIYQGTTYIYANDELEPTIEVEYVRDTNLSGYVQGQINNVVEIQQRKNTELEQTNESISTRVSDVSTALGTINDTLSTINETILKQTADQFQMLFNQTQVKGLIDDLNSLVNSNNTTLETLQAYINYGSTTYEGELTPYILLGASESPVKLMLIKNRIRFMNGESEMAFISNNALYINEMITKKINTGHWLTYEDSQYNLNTKWVNQ